MRLELTGRHLDITPPLRRLVERKLAKLERLLNDSAVSAQAVLTLERHRHCIDITLHARGEKFLHGRGASAAWESSISEAIDKIAQQAQKLKGKYQARKRDGAGKLAAAGPIEATPRPATAAKPARRPSVRQRMPRVLSRSRQALKAMSVADAARQMDADSDGIVVFRDVETESISVLYRRANGELTLVEMEM
jgi:putative sigma-54 modulation protein